MAKVTRTFRFEAAHRLLGHKGKCRHLHGHSYVATITVEGFLNDQGMVIDFGDLKDTVGKWIDEYLDHNIILHPDDPLLKNRKIAGGLSPVEDVFNGKEPFIMPKVCANPTAENIAQIIWWHADRLLSRDADGEERDLQVMSVVVRETENCSAST